MTNKELKKLRREDLLEMLLNQSKDVARQRETIGTLEKTLEEQCSVDERLKDKLNEKDAQMEHLKERLNEKDVQIERLKGRLDQKDATIQSLREELEQWQAGEGPGQTVAGTEAALSLRLNEIFEVARAAAEQYLRSKR